MLLAEQLVGEARERRQRKMDRRERLGRGHVCVLFLVVAVALALLRPVRASADPC